MAELLSGFFLLAKLGVAGHLAAEAEAHPPTNPAASIIGRHG